MYGANVLKMTSAEATRAVNEANASARRILKSLENQVNQQPVWCSHWFFHRSLLLIASRIVADLWWISNCVFIFLFVVIYPNSCAFIIASDGYAYLFVFVDYFFNGCGYCFVGFNLLSPSCSHARFLNTNLYRKLRDRYIFNLIFFMFFYLAFIFLPVYELLLLYIRCYVAHNVEHLLELLPIEQLTFCDG